MKETKEKNGDANDWERTMNGQMVGKILRDMKILTLGGDV
jgi:hypothetical protein